MSVVSLHFVFLYTPLSIFPFLLMPFLIVGCLWLQYSREIAKILIFERSLIIPALINIMECPESPLLDLI